jgi:surface antigen
MSFPRGGRRLRRVIGGTLVVTTAAMGLMSLATASHADDDYPYRGLGKCPLVPLPPKPKPSDTTDKPGHGPSHKPDKPGTTDKPGHGHSPGKPGDSPSEPPAPPPPRECAKHIWYYNGTYGDPWGFALRNCTSFVAWALRERNGLADFTNHMDGGSFGNAESWDDNAEALGYLVDDVPAVGAVAQTDSGRIGHVAWVSAVGDGTVTVEEYNYAVAGGYDVRTVPTSDFRYLHLDDIAPAPWQGTRRAATSVLDAQGQPWSARTTSSGDLLVAGPAGGQVRLGPAGSWSPDASPAVANDALGRTWVAAVSSAGGLLTAHTTADDHWTQPAGLGAGWSTTSSPALALDGRDRLHLFAITAAGTLSERTTTGSRWGHGGTLGRPGSWAPHASPAVVADASEHLWLTAVTRAGSLEVRQQHGRAGHWDRFRSLSSGASVTSTPALARAADGRIWLAGVSAKGDLQLVSTTGEEWRTAPSGGGRWSPYSSPALAADNSGRMWLAAERAGGRVVVRATLPHTAEWHPETATGVADETGSTTLVALPVGGVRVGAVTQDGHPRWWTLGLPRTSMAGGVGARGGGFSAILRLRMP